MLVVAQGGEHEMLGRFRRMPPGVQAQSLAGTDFQKRARPLFEQDREAVRETDSLPQVPAPVSGVRRLRGADPGPGHARNEGNRRRTELDCPHELLEGLEDRLHHLRVESMRSVQPAVRHFLLPELVLEGVENLGGARQHANRRSIDGSQRQSRARDFLELLF